MAAGRRSALEAPSSPKLDNLTLSRKEGWNRFVNAAPRQQPEHLGIEQLKQLSEPALASYNQRRRTWHANLGPIKTPQLQSLHEDLWDIIDSNEQDGDKAKGAIAIDALPGLGKTTSILAFAKEFHRREIRQAGEYTDQGQRRLPVCRVGLNGDIGMKDFNRAMLRFFGHPGTDRGTSTQLSGRALDCVLSCETKLFVDDLHFLKWRQTNGNQVSNHFKYIANEFPVTLLFAGVGLAHRGMFSEGESYEDAVLAQSGQQHRRACGA
jgi:AAA domain-containing protein